MDIEKRLKKELGENLKQNVPLKDVVAIGAGGVADYYFTASSTHELIRSINVVYDLSLPFIVIGNGNHVVPADAGFSGIVIKNESQNILFSSLSSEVIVDSGVSLARLINLAAGRDLGGLEFLGGLNDTIGGAVYHNVGNDRNHIGDYVKSITLLTEQQDYLAIVTSSGNIASFRKFIKNHTNYKMPIILTVRLQLVRRRKDEILHLLKNNAGNITSAKSVSGFYHQLPEYKTPVEVLINQSGVRKLRVGGACFDPKNSNCIINKKGALASDIRRLSEQAMERIKNKYDCDIKERAEYIGQWS